MAIREHSYFFKGYIDLFSCSCWKALAFYDYGQLCGIQLWKDSFECTKEVKGVWNNSTWNGERVLLLMPRQWCAGRYCGRSRCGWDRLLTLDPASSRDYNRGDALNLQGEKKALRCIRHKDPLPNKYKVRISKSQKHPSASSVARTDWTISAGNVFGHQKWNLIREDVNSGVKLPFESPLVLIQSTQSVEKGFEKSADLDR